MLTLTLVRHAKAAPQGHADDFSRDLTAKGRADAARLGVYLADRGLVPDVVFVSAAARTVQTFQALARKIGRAIPARFDEALYNATAGQIIDLLKSLDPSVGHVMIVAHNPGIMEAAILLTRDGDLQDIERLRHHFPPAATAMLTFDRTDWLDARASGGRLDLLLLPEDLVAPD